MELSGVGAVVEVEDEDELEAELYNVGRRRRANVYGRAEGGAVVLAWSKRPRPRRCG